MKVVDEHGYGQLRVYKYHHFSHFSSKKKDTLAGQKQKPF